MRRIQIADYPVTKIIIPSYVEKLHRDKTREREISVRSLCLNSHSAAPLSRLSKPPSPTRLKQNIVEISTQSQTPINEPRRRLVVLRWDGERPVPS